MEFSVFLVLITIVSFLLVVVIMVQNPKGGGLSSTLGGTQMMGGVQKTTDFLDKSTWTLGGILIALILLSSMSFGGGYGSDKPFVDESALPPAPATTTPAAPGATGNGTATPAAQPQGTATPAPQTQPQP